MKRILFLFSLLFLINSQDLYTQDMDVTVYLKTSQNEIKIFANNRKPYPISLELTLTLVAVETKKGLPEFFLIPAMTDSTLLTELVLPNQIGSSFKFNYKFWIGDFSATHEDKHIYSFPFEESEGYFLDQGYDGKLSHQRIFALDFSMEIGTPIYAARGGIVIKVKEDSDFGCPKLDCVDLANLITIFHDDNTFAEYVHLKYNGAVVSAGDSVETGDLIGYSGNTGYSTGPHLHFTVNRATEKGYKAVPTLFRLNKSKIGYLIEGRKYFHVKKRD
jgi:murein DD-endopeptidase MepM/ murein hydrolase activator NlpD